ncbi:MAG: pentapeptide repeat-containing protein, partial [Chloroflexota bacterium]|nr:pentapeptide repeat-containing protein [Chloroflexota bacterium]
IRDVIDTIARKVVLILGRFTPERKTVLDAIREELRKRDYLPVLFDFDKPATRDITETMRTLAHLSRFIIADISDPSSIPLELQAVIPDLAVPVKPLLLSGQREFSMFVDLRKKYHWVLNTHQYTDINDLLALFGDKVIAPAEQKAKELEKR